MMIDSKIFKGIEYIQTNELPQTQREKLDETLNKSLFIKILIDGKIISECLQYKDYSYWYNSVYQAKAQEAPVKTAPITFETKLVLNTN
jgi:hypothetical protein